MSLAQRALGGISRGSSQLRNFIGGVRPVKLLGSINRNARKIGVGARHVHSLGLALNNGFGGALTNLPVYDKSMSLLKTVGGLARDRDMTDPSMQSIFNRGYPPAEPRSNRPAVFQPAPR